MSTLVIREYTRIGTTYSGIKTPVAQEGGTVVDQTVTFTGTHGESAAFAADTTYIAMVADVAFAYQVAKAPIATTSMIRIPAETLIYIGVPGGYKISAVET